MRTTVRSWIASVSEALVSFRAPAELSRFSDTRLRDIGIDRESLGLTTSDVPWQVAEQGGTGAKVHLHIRMAA